MGFNDFGEDYLLDLAESSDQHPLLAAMYGIEFEFQTLHRYRDFLDCYLESKVSEPTEEVPLLVFAFPLKLAQSLLYMTFSTLDEALNSLCEAARRTFEIEVGCETSEGNNVVRAINYLTNTVGLTDLKRSRTRKLLLGWRSVRNCYIHASGKVTNDLDRKNIAALGLNVIRDTVEISVADTKEFSDLAYEFVHGVFDRLLAKAGLS